MVGDQPRDIEAGRAAGCRTILLGSTSETADHVVGTLSAAADIMLEAGSP
jgi:D-glycero-D-manno-heptose 1,7-bisphosphate phosphatase